MAYITADRVLETSTTTGTGPITTSSAVTGFRRFNAIPGIATGDTLPYFIEAINTGTGLPSGDWETGIGTYTSANTITRTLVLDSSNAGAAVNFAAGTRLVGVSLLSRNALGLPVVGGAMVNTIGSAVPSNGMPLVATSSTAAAFRLMSTTDLADFVSATRAQVEAELLAGTNVSFTYLGSGATRQIQVSATGGSGSAGVPVFPIRSFGAVYDGVTSDSAALAGAQAAATLAGGGMVFIEDTAAGTLLDAGTVFSGADVWIAAPPGGAKIISPYSVATVSATSFNVDFSTNMAGPYAITEIVESGGTDHTSTSVHALTVNSGNATSYDHGSIRLERVLSTAATPFVITLSSSLTDGFDFSAYNFRNNVARSSNSASRTSNVVTAGFATAHNFSIGDVITLTAFALSGNNGVVTVSATPTSTTLQYTQAGADGVFADQVGTFTAASYLRVQGDGTMTVSVNGGSASTSNFADLANDTALFMKKVAGVLQITTGTTPVVVEDDFVTRVELSAANAASFSYGDVLHIDTNLELDCSSPSENQRNFEVDAETVYGRVTTASAGYVYLTNRLKVDLNPATIKNARKYSNYKCVLENLVPVGKPVVESLQNGSQSCIGVIGVRNPLWINCGIGDIWNFGHLCRSNFRPIFNGFRANNARNSARIGSEQYGINLDGFNKYVQITNLNTEGIRHAITTQHPSSESTYQSTLSAVMRHGETKEWLVDGGICSNATGNAMDTHKNGRDGVVQNLKFVGGVRWRYGSIVPKHIQHRCGSMTYRNNHFSDYMDCVAVDNGSTSGYSEVRDLPNAIIFEGNHFNGSKFPDATRAIVGYNQRTVSVSGDISHNAIQTVVFRRNTFSGDCSRLFDLGGNYRIVIEDNDFSAVTVRAGGAFLRLVADVFSVYKTSLSFRRNAIDTTSWGTPGNALLYVQGTADIEVSDLQIKGTNYDAVLEFITPVSCTARVGANIRQLTQQREVVLDVSRTVPITYEDPRKVFLATPVGNVGTGNDTLQSYSLPARTLYNPQDTVRVRAWGTTANNANAKTIKLAFGTQNILDHTLTPSVAGAWEINADLGCYGLSVPSSIVTAVRTSNVVTAGTSAAHGLAPGDNIVVTLLSTDFNTAGTRVLTTPTTTSFTYSAPGADGTAVDQSGTVTPIYVKAVARVSEDGVAADDVELSYPTQSGTAPTTIACVATGVANNDVVQEGMIIYIDRP